ncbi:DUF916 and DUF3324 domain-containing protein [Lacticaseibacillus baoqingensis]|uniref:DUF916 and DUF3324 domain-containing protein n=1 Tax=Lacticaseibacillus baoqingensis TaxID=2486013 RepID=A0ABW4EBY8_9LACO|nr:DUF916 and DUF3324 domain-containing protein [Lacticaseibacillus baoqingensis]
MRRVYWWLLGAFVALTVLMVPNTVQAANGASFTVEPTLTAQQVGGNTGYFNMKLAPNQQNTLKVTITNLTAKPKTVRVVPTNAGTSAGGQLSYDPGMPRDDSAAYRFTALLVNRQAQTVKLAPNAAKQVTYTVKMPAKPVTGQILGGLHVQDTADYAQPGTGVAIVNRFAMVVAVQLQSTATMVAPDLKLLTVKPGVQSNRAAILAKLQNPQPRLFNHLKIVAKVTPRGQADPVVKRTSNNLSMAPNSHFTYGIYSDQALTAGKYTLILKATAHQWHWQFKRHFTITAQQAATTNRKAHLKVERHIPWTLIIIGALVVVILVLLVLLLKRRRSPQD